MRRKQKGIKWPKSMQIRTGYQSIYIPPLPGANAPLR